MRGRKAQDPTRAATKSEHLELTDGGWSLTLSGEYDDGQRTLGWIPALRIARRERSRS